jgi:hypothetical protein
VLRNRVILSVGFLTVEDTFDLEGVAVLAEEDPMVLRAKPDQRRCDAFQLFRSTFAGENITAQRLDNLDCDGLLDAADIRFSLVRPDDLFPHRGLWLAAHLLPFGHRQAEFREYLLVWNGGVVLAPFVGLGDGLGFGGTERVAILIQKYFEEIAHRAEFGKRQKIDEGMGLLALLLEIE